MGSLWNQHWGPCSSETQVLPGVWLHLMWGQEESPGLLLILVLTGSCSLSLFWVSLLPNKQCLSLFWVKLLLILALGQQVDEKLTHKSALWDWRSISQNEGILLDFAFCGLWNGFLKYSFAFCLPAMYQYLPFCFVIPWLQIYLVFIFVLFEKSLKMGSAPPTLSINTIFKVWIL